MPNPLIGRIFGPETNASDFAGVLSLSDAQLVALPVRALKDAFVYATCPLALARVKRLAELAGVNTNWVVPDVAADQAMVASDSLLSQGKVILEAFEFDTDEDDSGAIAKWLADHAIPRDSAHTFFADKIGTNLVILSDTDFTHFAHHSMVVEPHVRIDDDSGTAADTGLFYTENLPPESILVGLAQASVERFKKGDNERIAERFDADRVLHSVLAGAGDDSPGIAGQLLQIGGDATSGRGLVLVHPIKAG